MAENLGSLLAMGTAEVAHVFYNAQQGDMNLLEHSKASSGVEKGHILGRRDNNGPGQRNKLGNAQLCVAGSWRKVDQHIVELSPVDISYKLLNGPMNHRTPPDDRSVIVDHEAHRNELDLMAFSRFQPVSYRNGGFGHPHHQRNVRS